METSDVEHETADSDFRPPARKKSGTIRTMQGESRGKRVRGKRGRLAFILELPTEVVTEILSYLPPLDILKLSYVDKELRAMLTSPSANCIWVAARQNIPELPECPPDFTESGYARYLFLKICEVCGGRAMGLKSMPWIRIRLCSRCTKIFVMSGSSIINIVEGATHLFLNLLPYEPVWPDIEDDDYIQASEMTYLHTYFRPAAVTLAERIARLDTDDQAREFIDTWQERIIIIREHSRRLRAWIEGSREAAEQATNAAKQLRRDTIQTRLVELGHDPQDMQGSDFYLHRLVNQTAPLTEKAWPNVRRAMEEVIEWNKVFREEYLNRF